jgi:6-pyruvoyltetrahydropterin/6-carboxytetrahydropterin synthase
VEIALEGDLDPALGWVADYGEIGAAFKPLLARLDHHCLNEIEGLENPTAEVLAAWVFAQLRPSLRGLADVTVSETPATSAVYRP